MKKIKVLFTVPNFKTAGSGREMLNIVERLDRNIFEPWIGVQEVGGKLFDEVIAKGLPIVVQPFIVSEQDSTLSKYRKAGVLAQEFKPLGFDIWQSFNWSSDFSEALVAKKAGARFVYVKKNMNWGRKAWDAKTFLSKAVIARNKTMIARFFSSKKKKKQMKKVHLISGGVDIDTYKPGLDNSFRKKYGISDEAFLITCVAQFVRSKNIETLIKAVAQVEKVDLVLAGAHRDKEYTEEIKNLLKTQGVDSRVHITGALEDVNSLLNTSNVFVLPTGTYNGHEEGCPVAVLEAMATGTPCIVSDVAGNIDLIEDGKNGLLFKAGNEHHLADQIRELKTKPSYANSLAEKALDKVYQEHTLLKEAKQFEAVYKKLAKV